MEMLYAVNKKYPHSINYQQPSLTNIGIRPIISTISVRNIIAFTTETENNQNENTVTGFYVYVADLNTPWWSFRVLTNKYPITALKWDACGRYILMGDLTGNVQIWVPKDNMISEWIQLYCARFAGEPILEAAFFHNGRKFTFQTDKKDINNYMEKFQRAKYSPSLKQFGGAPAEGVLVVTTTGLLGAFLIPSESMNVSSSAAPQLPHTLPTTMRSLGHFRNYYFIADITYDKDGNFLIALPYGNMDPKSSSILHVYKVTITKIHDKLIINSKSLPSFYLAAGAGRDISDMRITHLKWINNNNEDFDSIMVGTRYSSGCFIEIWSLVEKVFPLHSQFKQLFQQLNKKEAFKTMIWTHQANYKYSSKIVDICTSKFHYGNSSYIFVSMMDNTIHCLHRDTLKRLTNASLTCVWRNDNDHGAKQIRIDSPIAAHDITHVGHLLVAVDAQGQLYAYRVSYPHQDSSGGQQSIAYTVLLLEYCLAGGYDPLDIFLTLRVQHLDQIVDRLTENFYRQSSSTQQFYYVNFMAMRANLYRLTVSGQTKAHDLSSLLMLHSILIAFKSLLRPSDLTSHDKGPAENLATVLLESVPSDIDKVLLGLEPKDFTVEPSTLQSLQQLIQWVADLALNILAKLPENRPVAGMIRNTNAGYDISKDIVALNSIRELLVMMRIWGLLKPQCLPVFSRSAENLDILATLFRLLTRLALNLQDPDEVLLDECCLLPSQVLIPQLQYNSPQFSVASPITFFMSNANLPIKFEFNTEPQCLKFCPDIPSVEGGLAGDTTVDSIRHIQLGKRPTTIRRCTRCGASSSIQSLARTAAMRAWEQRWVGGCRCGGVWRLQAAGEG